MEIPHIPGLHFNPKGSELLSYLKQRIIDYFEDPNRSTNSYLIPDVELHQWDPKDLPTLYNVLSEGRSNGKQWFFFCPHKEKYRNSRRKERTVANVGYWKVTSSDKKVKGEDAHEEIGKKKTLTFYRGRTPNGRLTRWGMHEYHLNPSYIGYDIEEMPFVVCCVFKRSGSKDDDDDELTFIEEVSSNHATSESRAPTYQGVAREEAARLQPLPEIQQVPCYLDNYSITEGAGSSLGGLLDCHVSDSVFAPPAETSNHLLCQDDWYSQYYH